MPNPLPGGENSTDLAAILSLVHKETGVDFTVYKMPTVNRRIHRRMLLNNVTTVKAYAGILADNTPEINILYQDLLINVTDFFRDTETHLYLKKELLPKLLSAKTAGETLRIWIPACSTGEEAYSIAMNILEIQGSTDTHLPVQIFATDLSAGAIVKARLGEYDVKAVASVSPKRIQRFYTKAGNRFRIAKAVRDMCVFAPHNILTDPPFSHVDFISCCNMLIYLDMAAQKKVMSTFHYALNNGGYLMLGKSETIGTASHLFSQVNKKYKVYARKNTATRHALPQLLPRAKSRVVPAKDARSPFTAGKTSPEHAFSGTVDALLLSRYVPASVVINQHLEILQFRGATDRYLKHPAGKASLNLLKMSPPEMAFELRIAVSKTLKEKTASRKTSIEVKTGAAIKVVTVEVVPLALEWDEPLMLVVFGEEDRQTAPLVPGMKGKKDSFRDRRIKKLEDDLAAARENMQVFAQEQEAFSEELQSANEEVVSSNEELQSLNEELETSKEEIESSNEELITTNQELHTRNELLNESYDYSEAIINTMHEPMLVLDKDLRIKSANGSFYKNFLVNEEETIGALLFDLGNRQWAIPRLRKLLENTVLKNTEVHDFEVSNSFPGLGERTILLNARRIIQKNHGGQLILLAFNDITERAYIQQKEKEGFIYAAIKDKVQNKRLEKSVTERTRELAHANKILEQNIHDLEIMNDELQAFAFVSSHDLQEPLRKIQTFAAKILEKDHQNLSVQGKGYFERIQVAAKRMRTLIQDLIAYSKINASERSFVKTDPTVIISEVIKDLEDSILEKKAVVEVNVKCNVAIILFQFRQLIFNLVSNALKFSIPGQPPHIQIKSSLVKTNKLNINSKDKSLHGCCLISIADNGIGFDKKYNDRIFAVFQKLHSRDEFEGTGIGLAIVKKIVENHHGIITVHSRPGKGTRFDLYMPL